MSKVHWAEAEMKREREIHTYRWNVLVSFVEHLAAKYPDIIGPEVERYKKKVADSGPYVPINPEKIDWNE